MFFIGRTWNGVLCGVALAGLAAAQSAAAAPSAALGLRAGTPGYGAEVDFGLTESFTGRVGYSFLNYNRTIDDTDVTYDGKLKISNAAALLDWNVFKGGFHLTLGAVSGGFKVDATGEPAPGNVYEVNGTTYTSAQLGSINGRIKFGSSFAPYLGLGWGNPVDSAAHWTFQFDIGAIYGGAPKVTLNATCGVAAPQGTPLCSQIQQDVLAERQDLEDSVTLIKWYPVINLGIAYRF